MTDREVLVQLIYGTFGLVDAIKTSANAEANRFGFSTMEDVCKVILRTSNYEAADYALAVARKHVKENHVGE